MKLKLLALMMALASLGVPAFGQGTAFVYQGRFSANGIPVTGSYDLTFSLFTSPSGGTQVGSTETNLAVGVANGLFTSTVDFGPGIFTGPPLWLGIGVRTNGSTGGFTGLSTLQPITTTPYAVQAGSASNLLGALPASSLSGTYGSPITLSNPANSFSGNGTGLTNVNAGQLGGLTATNFWQTAGNAGTSPTRGNYLGTTDNNPLELHVNGARALRLEPGSSPNVIGGYVGNVVTSGATGATIAGGGASGATNRVTSSGGTVGGGNNNAVNNVNGTVSGGTGNVAAGIASSVGGGSGNTAGWDYSGIGGGQGNNVVQIGADHSIIAGGENNAIQAGGFAAAIGGGNNNTNNGNAGTIAGGQNNLIIGGGYQPTVGGGFGNVANNWYSTIAGGNQNTNLGNSGTIGGGLINLAGNYSQPTVGGGNNNQALNSYSTVPGGYQNVASGQDSFAAGQQANALHTGAFVWADSQAGSFSSTSSNQFLIRAQGGVGINTSNPKGASLYVVGSRTNGFSNSMSTFENTNTVNNTSPALRVLVDGGTPMDGALSVSSQITPTTPGLIAKFGNAYAFAAWITNNGTIYANGFVGDGSGLTGLSAASLGDNLITTSGLDGVAVNTNLYITRHALYLRGDYGIDHNHGLAYNGGGITNFPSASVQPNGPVLWGYTGGALAVLNGGAAAVLNWNSTGVSVAGTLTSSNFSGNGAVGWQTAGGAVQAAPDNGYLATSGSQVAVTLPASANLADIVRVSGGGGGGWMIAQNAGQSVVGNFVSGANFRGTWSNAGAGTAAFWTGVASSADGTHLVAVGEENYPNSSIYTSANSGLTWTTNNNAPPANWNGVASSWDGTHLVAIAAGSGIAGPIYTSVDSGVTWTSNTVTPQVWSCVASAADGEHLAAGVAGGVIYTSANGGGTWTASTTSGTGQWNGIAYSANGSTVFAVDYDSAYIFKSTDGGATWNPINGIGQPTEAWDAVACSSDGSKILAAGIYPGEDAGPMWFSHNGGASWTRANLGAASTNSWTRVASSANGVDFVATTGYDNHTGQIYYSTNSGANWTAVGPTESWAGIASSADGTKLVAVATFGTPIYLSQAPAQTLTTAGTAGALSGEQAAVTELQYIGNNQFMQISHQGTIFAY